MPSRVATGSVGDPSRWKTLILGDPSVVERGLRILETDLTTGTAGTVDLLAVDRAGQLAVIALAEADPDQALRRLLDQYLWACDRYDLLVRAHGVHGPSPERIVRPLLIASSFSFPFLHRLQLLAVEVTPYLVQTGRYRGEEVVTVRPAVEAFRLPGRRPAPVETAQAGPGAGPPAATRTERQPAAEASPFAAAAVAGAPAGAPGEFTDALVGDDVAIPGFPPGSDAEFEAAVFPPLAAAGFPDQAPEFILPEEPLPAPPDGGMSHGTDEVIEPLSAEELAEFVRFDRQRRERDGRPS